MKLAECNSPHPAQENKPPPCKPALDPPTGHLKPAPTIRPANSKPAPTKGSKRSKLAECNSPDCAPENEPSAPPAKRLKLTLANPLFNDRDRKTLLSGGWLSDKHTNAAHKLMAQKFPSQHGLQDTLTLDKFDRYQSSNEDFIQLINVAGNHWVCASNRLSPPGIVHVYDSLPSSSINSSSLHRQIAAIMKTEDASFTVKHVAVQRQVGNSDCGLFAIAYATSLCSGLDPHTLKYDQSEMRSKFQLELYERYASTILCIDSTHGTNQYRFKLITINVDLYNTFNVRKGLTNFEVKGRWFLVA